MYNIKGQKQESKGYAVQVASLNEKSSLDRMQSKLESLFLKNILISYNTANDNVHNYKVFIGPFDTALEASSYQKSLKKKNVSGFIVDLTTFK